MANGDKCLMRAPNTKAGQSQKIQRQKENREREKRYTT